MRQGLPKHLILTLPMSQYWCRTIALGAAKYARNVGNWYPVLMDHLAVEKALREKRSLEPWAGVIGNFYDSHADLVRWLREWGVPVVNVSSEHLPETVPTVCNNELETGRMAARYLYGEGHRRFAFIGIQGRFFSDKRRSGYAAYLSENGIEEIHDASEVAYGALESWIPQIPRPCAVFAANDTRARHMLWACTANGLHVPQEVSVLGVDDDELFCHMNQVATSSVAPAWEAIGSRAAAVLDAVAQDPLAYPEDYREEMLPRKVTVRQSTDHVAVDDPFVARALAIIKEEGMEGLKVYDLAQKLGISRRTLERRFENSLQTPVRAAMVNARLEKAHRLLGTTQLSIGEIAARTGFSMHSRFDEAFKKRYSRTPSQVRRGLT
jgi:LacI family transcriptional regulator